MRLALGLVVCAVLCTTPSQAAENPEQKFSFESLERLGVFSSSHTVEDFLSRLPRSFRSNPVFIHSSESLQSSSHESPRALISEPDGIFFLTFNGDPSQRGHTSLETLAYNKGAGTFTLREIEAIDGRMIVSAPNPPRCLVCHRAGDPRPIWESYDQWPANYGSEDDGLARSEGAPFVRFILNSVNHPRYSLLDLSHLLPRALKDSFGSGRLPKEPNISMTHDLSRINLDRVARIITQSRDYAVYKYLIFAALNCSSRGDMKSFNLPGNHSDILDYYSDLEIREAEEVMPFYGQKASLQTTLKFRSLFDSRGIDTSDWFMNFRGGLSNNFVNGGSWESMLKLSLLERDPELQSYVVPGTLDQVNCGKADEKNAVTLEHHSQNYLRLPTDANLPERIWNRSCVQCHSVDAEHSKAPKFGLNEAIRSPHFKDWITSGKMPKGQALTSSEKNALLRLQVPR